MKKRLLAIFIVIVMLLSHTTIFADIDLSTSTASNDDTAYLDEETNEIVVLRENEDLREANIKHFDLSNGISKAVMYSQAVHYLDENGKWIDINNTLALSGNEYSTNNKSEIKFANKSGSNGLLSIKDGDYKIDLTPLDTNKVSVEIENPQENNSRKFDDVKKLSNLVSKATYKNIYDGIDLEYILTGNNIKENIIVNSEQDNYVYTFELKLNKLNAELVDNSIALYDSDTGEKMYVIPAPYMYDSEGEVSQEVEYTLTKNNKWKYTLTVEASKEWINLEERSFPVTIDPTIIADTMVTDDCYTSYQDANATMQYMIVGNFMGYKNVTSYINFQTIPTVPQGNKFVKATSSVFVSYVDKPSDYTFLIGAYEAKTNWQNSQTWDSSNTENYLERQLSDTVSITTTGIYEWDISTLYNKWLTENDGMCLRAVGLGQGTSARIHITTSEAVDSPIPQLELTYVSHIGVEDYYGYAYNTLGSYGESYVNLYNGSLTYINHLTTISNGSLSYDINMVYNSIEQAWKPSFNENIELYDDDGIERYIWTDADGTKHWFTPYMEKNYWGQYLYYNVSADGTKTQTTTPTEFYPEDDIDYVLAKSTNNEFILKDYQGNQRLFDENGRLSKICDAQGNVLHFNNYLGIDQNNVASIYTKDSTTGEVSFSLEIFYFNSGRISQIFDNQNQKKIEFSWTNGLLNTIEYFDFDIETSYETIYFQHYDSNDKLSSVFDDFTKQKIKYYIEANDEEDSTDDNKIVEILNKNGNLEQTTKKYIIGESFYVNLGNDFIFNTSDDLLTTFAFDNKGRKVTTTTANIIETYTYNDSILPDDTYYSTTYNQNINNHGFNLVKHNIQTNSNEYLSLDVNNISNTSSISTTNVDVSYGVVENTLESPYKMVCQVIAYYGDSSFISTGFLCGPNTVMMSGHSLRKDVTSNNVRDFAFPSKIEIIPGQYVNGNNVVEKPFGTYEAITCYISREYNYVFNKSHTESYKFDWAICELNENVGDQLGYFSVMVTPTNVLNQNIMLFGYAGETKNMYWSKGIITSYDDKRFFYNALTNDGISGSPIFLNDGQYKVCGLHTSGSPNRGGTRINSLIFSLVEFLNK